MKRAALVSVFVVMLLVSGACGRQTRDQGVARGSVTLSVIGTNDVHGAVVEKEGAGGLALFGGYVANLRGARARDGGAVLLIDAGDMWQGTLESNVPEGAPVLAAYNVLGYNAVAIGNHEFDFGPEGPGATAQSDADDPRGALKARAAAANFPFLAANLIDEATDAPVNWPNVKPSHRLDVAGIAVGIVGVTTRYTLRATLSANVVGLRIAGLAETIQAEAEALRHAGVQLVIVTAHAGGDCTRFDDPADLSSCVPDSEIFDVARALPPGLVDLIVAGHVHKGIAHEINGIAVISSWSGGNVFGRVDFRLANGLVTKRRIHAPARICRYVDTASGECRAAANLDGAAAAIYEGLAVKPDKAVEAALAPAIAATAQLKSGKLGPRLDSAFRRRPYPESPIGNLVTDIMLASEPLAGVAIYNTLGGIRADLPAGELTFGDVYEMMPFDNRIVHVTLSGAELKSVAANQIEGSIRRGHVSGIRVVANCDDDELSLIIVDGNGREVRDEERVLVVTNDFLITGGDGIMTPVMPPEGFNIEYEGPLVRDVIVDWMRDRDGNLHEDQFNSESNPRWNLPGPAPVHCAPSVL